MKKQLNQVLEFQNAFNQVTAEKPSLVNDNSFELRFYLMKEENEEYLEACRSKDIVGIADAISDMLYIAFGTALTHGMQHIIEDCFEEVHRSNMSKLGEDGKPVINGVNGVFDLSRPIGKVLKPFHYLPPNLEKFIFADYDVEFETLDNGIQTNE